MPNTHNQNDQPAVLDRAQQPIVAHAIPPETDEPPAQGFAKAAGIFISGESLAGESQNTFLGGPVEPAQLVPRPACAARSSHSTLQVKLSLQLFLGPSPGRLREALLGGSQIFEILLERC